MTRAPNLTVHDGGKLSDRERAARLAGRLREAEERERLLVDLLVWANDDNARLLDLLARIGVASLLPAIGHGNEEAVAVARDLLVVAKERQVERGALERAVERMVLAEHAVEQARRALPALREAAQGTSRPRVLAAIEALAGALDGGAHG